MAEIERKFRVARVPDQQTLGPGAELRQGYLAVDGDVEVRVRDEDGTRTLTVKGGRGLERAEVEVALDPARFAELWPLAGDRTVEKTRHRIAVGEYTAELDLYAGKLAGLAVVEVEFPGRDEAERFVAPDWFGPELTSVPGWSNAALARDGVPPGS
jgi:adenylate cyclase